MIKCLGQFRSSGLASFCKVTDQCATQTERGRGGHSRGCMCLRAVGRSTQQTEEEGSISTGTAATSGCVQGTRWRSR